MCNYLAVGTKLYITEYETIVFIYIDTYKMFLFSKANKILRKYLIVYSARLFILDIGDSEPFIWFYYLGH
jgi:hypothetical protein